MNATKYSVLEKSTIEGIEIYAEKFKNLYYTVTTDPADVLDHRSKQFNATFQTYTDNLKILEEELRHFIEKSLKLVKNTENSLRLLQRFDKLNLNSLNLDVSYVKVLEMYHGDILDLSEIYNYERKEPPIPYNTPKFAGRIMWIRGLMKRIEEPLKIFKKKPKVMSTKEAQKCVQLYNQMMEIFLYCEMTYYEDWKKSINQVIYKMSILGNF